MDRLFIPTGARATIVPIGILVVGDVCDPGLPVYLTRNAPGEDDGCVRARTLRDGFEVRVHAEQLAVVPPDLARVEILRRCA